MRKHGHVVLNLVWLNVSCSVGRSTQGQPSFAVCSSLALLTSAQYLSESETGHSARFTDSLLTVIRQQRHLGTRVVVSTQEPTVVPTKFLDLCSFVVVHRFTSPTWLHVLSKHVSAAEAFPSELFQKVCLLQCIWYCASRESHLNDI